MLNNHALHFPSVLDRIRRAALPVLIWNALAHIQRFDLVWCLAAIKAMSPGHILPAREVHRVCLQPVVSDKGTDDEPLHSRKDNLSRLALARLITHA